MDYWVRFFNKFTYENSANAYDQHVQDNREDKCGTVSGVDELRKPCLDPYELVKNRLIFLNIDLILLEIE